MNYNDSQKDILDTMLFRAMTLHSFSKITNLPHYGGRSPQQVLLQECEMMVGDEFFRFLAVLTAFAKTTDLESDDIEKYLYDFESSDFQDRLNNGDFNSYNYSSLIQSALNALFMLRVDARMGNPMFSNYSSDMSKGAAKCSNICVPHFIKYEEVGIYAVPLIIASNVIHIASDLDCINTLELNDNYRLGILGLQGLFMELSDEKLPVSSVIKKLLGTCVITLLHITKTPGSVYDISTPVLKSRALSLGNVNTIAYNAVSAIRELCDFPEIRFPTGLTL